VTSRSPLRAGADRFSGFADLYDKVRPTVPGEFGEILSSYFGTRPKLVVDLGSGTGLSCRWASRWADEVVGVEPGDEMRAVAESRDDGNVGFRRGWSHDTGMPTGLADVVVAVQALHWMEPSSTFLEVARILRPGGVFAAIDCDWPPVVGDAVAERAWNTCLRRVQEFETELAHRSTRYGFVAPPLEDHESAPGDFELLLEGVRKWPKAEHLERMVASGVFDWCREVAAASSEEGDAQRFIDLLKSQGDYQTLKRHGVDDTSLGVEAFCALVRSRLGDEVRPFRFVYRAMIGFKA
jgi:SAM-dependent methyltransferase